jgi:hypothetical protein
MITVSIVDRARQLTRHRQHRQYRRGDQAGGGHFGTSTEACVQTMLTVLTQKPDVSGDLSI